VKQSDYDEKILGDSTVPRKYIGTRNLQRRARQIVTAETPTYHPDRIRDISPAEYFTTPSPNTITNSTPEQNSYRGDTPVSNNSTRPRAPM
jgi:hypothetical protein